MLCPTGCLLSVQSQEPRDGDSQQETNNCRQGIHHGEGTQADCRAQVTGGCLTKVGAVAVQTLYALVCAEASWGWPHGPGRVKEVKINSDTLWHTSAIEMALEHGACSNGRSCADATKKISS